jgi:CRISPR-associated protein Csb2
MVDFLDISVTFIDPQFHGRGDGGEPEWPPSPLRLMQALVAANADQVGSGGELDAALRWLERQPPPTMVTPNHAKASPYCLSVPNNAMDLVAKAWAKGNYFGTRDSNPATHRTMKTIQPTRMLDSDTVHYLWPVETHDSATVQTLAEAAAKLVALGWGIDLVVGRAERLSSNDLQSLSGHRWTASPSGSTPLRTPKAGTLDNLIRKHDDFLTRIGQDGFCPVPPLRDLDITRYRRDDEPLGSPYRTFELRNTDGTRFRYSHRRLIHLAGMVRHLAIRAMTQAPPAGVPDNWVEQYVAGHAAPGDEDHRQLSYLPLPSIGHPHADPGIRRVMIAAPTGDDRWLDYIARQLTGRALEPESQGPKFPGDPPILQPVKSDPVIRQYIQPSAVWHSFTPVILPGHDDHKPRKTRSLIERALLQSGIDQPCQFEWSAFSKFPKSYSAHKYGKDKRPQGYYRPDHLMTQTAVHLTLRFENNLRVPGPIAVGAGRHCGFGLMVGEAD